MANDDQRLKRLKSAQQLAASLASVHNSEEADAEKKKADADSKKLAFAPDAVKKLPDKAGAVTSLYNNEISAILLHCYQVQMSHQQKTCACREA